MCVDSIIYESSKDGSTSITNGTSRDHEADLIETASYQNSVRRKALKVKAMLISAKNSIPEIKESDTNDG